MATETLGSGQVQTWIKAAFIFIGSTALGVLLLIIHALAKTEAVARAYSLSERLVESQLRRLPEVKQLEQRSDWLGMVRHCRDQSYPATALFTAFVRVPHLCRQSLRQLAAEERLALGGWRPWTRTGKAIHRFCIHVLEEMWLESTRAAVIAYNGRINWGKIPASGSMPEEHLRRILRNPRVIRASLFSEADALEGILRDIEPEDPDRQIFERAYREVVDLLHRPANEPLDLPALMDAKSAVLPAASVLTKKINAAINEELRRRAGLAPV